MSWFERLNALNLPNDNCVRVNNAVYFGGSKFIKRQILEEIAKEYPWASVSNITFQNLYSRYNENVEKVLAHLLNDRCEPMIYENSNENVILLQIVQKYLNRRVVRVDSETLENIYKECCDLLQESSNQKSVLVLDCRKSYFETYKHQYRDEIYLQTFAFIALMHKRVLFPFMDVVIIIDEVIYEKFGDEMRTLYKLLRLNISSNDIILQNMDKGIIKKLLVNAHKSCDFIESDLC